MVSYLVSVGVGLVIRVVQHCRQHYQDVEIPAERCGRRVEQRLYLRHVRHVRLDRDGPRLLAETSEAMFDATFGTFPCCREAARRLVRDGRGRIVTFSSSGVGSLRPSYSASKVAVEVMTKILARELRGTGITANVVAPGSTGTPMMYTGKTEDDMERYIAEAPLGWLGMPEDIAPLVSFLASDAGHWVNAEVLCCNGGTI